MVNSALKEERDERRAKGQDVTDSEDELDEEERKRQMRRQKSQDKAAKAAATAAAKGDVDAESSSVGNANKSKKAGRKKPQATGTNSVRERKSSGKAPGAKLRSQTEKLSSKRVAADGAQKRSGALARSNSALGSSSTGSSGSSPTTKRKGAAMKSKAKAGGAKPTKATKKREKDVSKSVGGAREVLQQVRKLERNNSKAMMAAEAEKLGMGKKKETTQTKGNVASASFMTLAGR